MKEKCHDEYRDSLIGNICLYFISREEKREYIFDDNVYNINKKQRDIFVWGLTNSVLFTGNMFIRY